MVFGYWLEYNLIMASTESDDLGVYELADEHKNTVYYGSGKLKTELIDHLNRGEHSSVKFYRVEILGCDEKCSERLEALLVEYRKLHGHLSTYNLMGGLSDARK